MADGHHRRERGVVTVTETANRTEKAVRIASYIDNTPTAKAGGVDAAAVRRFSEVTWAQLAEMDSLGTSPKAVPPCS